MALTIDDSIKRLLRRDSGEHVVLADCKGSQNSSELSSEIAYFTSKPDDTPDDISVATSNGSYTQWADSTTSALFIDTGVTFTAKLGASGKTGDKAGTGNNGYGDFTCWQGDSSYLYSHNNKNCTMVYDCDHPASSSTSSASATATSSSTASATTSSTASSGSSGLSVGAYVGMSIGVAIGAISLIGIAAFFLYRHWSSNKRGQPKDPEGAGQKPGFSGRPDQSPQLAGSMVKTELETPPVVHELYAQPDPVEMHNDYVRGEMDGTSRAELATPSSPPTYESPIIPYGHQRGLAREFIVTK
ncbi:hypothetical protein F5B20DRAFT_539046 [Whalleya microplaca]|nr:hypothetical protein F5B20DRAFT_539046 [Whalleya microplaca]